VRLPEGPLKERDSGFISLHKSLLPHTSSCWEKGYTRLGQEPVRQDWPLDGHLYQSYHS
jgi:hypothetical protein